jgi:lincosamide nucleotidyltransferase A/C/D/E
LKPGPLIRKVDCLQLPVGDLEAGVAFYERLGHEVIWRRSTQVGLRLPDTDAELVLQTERAGARVDLLVEDVRAAVERFVAAGGRVVVEPFPIEIGLCAVVADPHGNELELLDMSKGPLDPAGMRASDVVAVLDALSRAGCRAWVGGGWGVDALAGRQTRPHRDLDLAIDADHEAAAITALGSLGFVIETDWRPVRVELAAEDGRRVDLHPVVFGADGTGRQADLDGGHFEYPRDGFTTGSIEDVPVPCLTVDQQLRFHSGYEPRDHDRHDLALPHRSSTTASCGREQQMRALPVAGGSTGSGS